jgi:hypothetical protein
MDFRGAIVVELSHDLSCAKSFFGNRSIRVYLNPLARNMEIESLPTNRAKDVKEIYSRTIAQRMVNEKEAMRRKLHQAQSQTNSLYKRWRSI